MFKEIIISIAVCCSYAAAKADVVGTSPNEAGGQIMLTDNSSPQCTATGDDYMVVLSTVPDVNAAPVRGCWRAIGTQVHVLWKSGAEKLFPQDRFTLTSYFHQTYDNKPVKGRSL